MTLSMFNPNIKIQILIHCPYAFPMEVVGRSYFSTRFILCDLALILITYLLN